MIVVLVGEEGAAALAGLGDATEVHAVGFDPRGLTSRPVAVHTRSEADVAQSVAADKVIGGDPALWGNVKTPEITPEIISDPLPADYPPEMIVEQAPKRRGRPPKVK